MTYKILKLTSTEDIIGDYEEKDGKCIINKPAKIVMFPTEQGGMGMALMPWVPFTEEEDIAIRENCIMTVLEPSEDVLNEYRRRFGSGLDIPNSKKELIL